MSITVRIPSGMRTTTNGQNEISLQDETISDMISSLDRHFPGIRDMLCSEDGALHKFVMLAIDGVDVRTLEGLDTKIPPGANIDIVRAFAGG